MFFADAAKVPRAEAACAVCARNDWLEHRHNLYLFAGVPTAHAKRPGGVQYAVILIAWTQISDVDPSVTRALRVCSRHTCKQVQVVPVLEPIIPGADGTCRLGPRHFSCISKEHPFGPQAATQLKPCKVLHHTSILLAGDGSAAVFSDQKLRTISVFHLTIVFLSPVVGNVTLDHEV